MTQSEWLSIMHHDVKLWDMAEQELVKGGIKLTMRDMPYGIGDAEVTLEGVSDANERRNAVGTYGSYIRGLIDNEIDDEAVEARAKQAAAFASEDADRDAVGLGLDSSAEGVEGKTPPVQAMAGAQAVQTFVQSVAVSTDPATRLSELRAGVGDARSYISTTSREIKALEAYVAVMDTQKAPQEEPSDE